MALRSMTAFGVGESTQGSIRYRCEIKTLNSRFADINVRIPRYLNAIETEIIARAKAALIRGKVDISFDIVTPNAVERLPRFNQAAMDYYLGICMQTQQMLQSKSGEKSHALPDITQLLRLEGVLEPLQYDSPEATMQKHRDGLLQSLDNALNQVNATRAGEGQSLKKALQEIIQSLGQDRQALMKKAGEFQTGLFAQYKKRLEQLLERLGETGQKVKELVPDERLLSELVILTDKSDIAEELTRLEIHEREFLKLIDQGHDVGRKLDFLCQEMHREVNTMSNKLTAVEASQHTLSMKQAIERIRQQVQNIE